MFDIERIAWLEGVGMRRYKVASRSVEDRRLIEACAATGKRLIVSLGMWDGADFPADQRARRRRFPLLRRRNIRRHSPICKLGKVDFTRYAGFSDHTIGIDAAMAAFSRGARIIEKHFTLDKTMYGPDHAGSMTPDELAAL